LRKGFAFSFLLIVTGLGLAVWWMEHAEDSIMTPMKTSSKQIAWDQKIDRTKISGDQRSTAPIPTGNKKKISELQEILDSKNDNDPRLDSDFKDLNENEKASLQGRYLSYRPESLNERGTLVFLLGRNIKTEEDVRFMQHVLKEKPCLSLENCAAQAPKATGEAAHEASVNDVTLVYPQIVSIKSMENLLFKNPTDSKLKPLVLKALEEASSSKSPLIANMARKTLEKATP
jgi:hypothetical protein